MISNMNFFDELIKKVRLIGFAPVSKDQKYRQKYSLHTLIRDAIGMADRTEIRSLSESPFDINQKVSAKSWSISADSADVVYWEFQIHRDFLKKIHNLIDDEVSKLVDRQMNAFVWASMSERREVEIIELLENLRDKHPKLINPPNAIKRPSSLQMIQEGKAYGAIGNTCAVIAANGVNYGDLFELIAEIGNSNEKLLQSLDEYTLSNEMDRTLVDRKSLVPKSFVSAHQSYKNQIQKISQSEPTMSDYLRFLQLSNNLSGNSDQTLIDRFNRTENVVV